MVSSPSKCTRPSTTPDSDLGPVTRSFRNQFEKLSIFFWLDSFYERTLVGIYFTVWTLTRDKVLYIRGVLVLENRQTSNNIEVRNLDTDRVSSTSYFIDDLLVYVRLVV